MPRQQVFRRLSRRACIDSGVTIAEQVRQGQQGIFIRITDEHFPYADGIREHLFIVLRFCPETGEQTIRQKSTRRNGSFPVSGWRVCPDAKKDAGEACAAAPAQVGAGQGQGSVVMAGAASLMT